MFVILPEGELLPESRPPREEINGLADCFEGCVVIQTGIATGSVTVTAEFLDEAPDPDGTDPDDLDRWDDVVEVSVHLPVPGARIRAFEDEGPEDWPDVNHQGPGWYRLRVYCRGRDTEIDATVDESQERYQIVVWPAPQTLPVMLRVTDRVGRSMRRKASRASA
ncbi:hypothetical protein [Kineosporia sp. NBRC 101731]|uniref:hypothetical protein n=1 Tax=Kineosporia sp. NBRC 101731 TaxID=3032199 RepID=UPI0025568508|nr:hypothetical protein [Kineosporia sp. NBRC 101731]